MKLCGFTIASTIFTILVGAIASGCTSFAAPNVQQSKSFITHTTSQTVVSTETENTSTATNQGLEIKGEQYRYYDEEGNQEWRAITELNPIQEGVIFDGKNYWCIPPRREAGVCSENGWMPIR
ncbi:MAG: hypothetical protein KAF91_08520 [Nostoc sp. TH1S01]|nr:hypothetical protein [Nostoc sp. TH1S01]